jgi:excisionase family DNA binding protein
MLRRYHTFRLKAGAHNSIWRGSIDMRPNPLVPPGHFEEIALNANDHQERLEPLQVTIVEAARLLAYDTRTIRRLIIRGELVAVGEGRMRRVPVQALRDYQQRHIIK